MAKGNSRLEAARRAYREAMEAARASPSAEAWSRLLAAGKELSAVSEPRSRAGGRRARPGPLEDPPMQEQPEPEPELEGTRD